MDSYFERIESLVEKVEDWSLLPAEPLVSVSMITFNHAKFIRQAIDGVLIQETTFPYEVVIGEDKSTDQTREIVKEYQRSYPDRIRLRLAKENLYSQKLKPGVGVLNACRGKYIAICEGDDYWTDPRKLQKQVEFLETHPECSICFHAHEVLYEDGSRPPHLSPSPPGITTTLADLLENNFIGTATVMFRRRDAQELPGWFWELPMGDWPLHILNAQHGNIGYIDEVMSVYRFHSGGIWSSRSRIHQVAGRLDMFRHLKAYLDPRYQKIIRATMARAYLLLAVAYADEGKVECARENLRRSIAECPVNGRAQLVARIALALRLYTPQFYERLRGVWLWWTAGLARR